MIKEEFEQWLHGEIRNTKIKLSMTHSDYHEGYSNALIDVLKKLKGEKQ